MSPPFVWLPFVEQEPPELVLHAMTDPPAEPPFVLQIMAPALFAPAFVEQ